MEAQMIYYAKDGMRFDDPVKCAEYERGLGVMPGTIGDMKKTLEPRKDCYVTGTLVVWHNEQSCSTTFTTAKIDKRLEEYTDIDELSEEDLYIKCNIETVINYVSQHYNDDDLCECSFLYSQRLDFKNASYMRIANPLYWEKVNGRK